MVEAGTSIRELPITIPTIMAAPPTATAMAPSAMEVEPLHPPRRPSLEATTTTTTETMRKRTLTRAFARECTEPTAAATASAIVDVDAG